MRTREDRVRPSRLPGDTRRDDVIGLLPRKEGKVQARHLERLAVVYVRQSSPSLITPGGTRDDAVGRVRAGQAKRQSC
jgi:hypothetical protein